MRTPSLLLVLLLCPTLACPHPADTEASSGAASNIDAGPPPNTTHAESNQTGEPTVEPSTGPTEDPGKPAIGADLIPSDATLKVDTEHSRVGFAVARATVGHLGEFDEFDATLTLAAGKPVALEIAVKTGSVAADRKGLTSHLKSADFFYVDKFPTATFTATKFTPDTESGTDAYNVEGTMHLHGVGRKLEFPATIEVASDQVVGRATLDISAKTFGIDYAGMEAELAEDAVQLEIELVFPRVAGP